MRFKYSIVAMYVVRVENASVCYVKVLKFLTGKYGDHSKETVYCAYIVCVMWLGHIQFDSCVLILCVFFSDEKQLKNVYTC